MRYFVHGVLACLFFTVGCDKPDEVYKPNPVDFDPEFANGFAANVNKLFEGEKEFKDETAAAQADGGVTTVEICTDEEVAAKMKWMVNQPIIPMIGAGGIDMTGGPDWGGITIDEAQSPNNLCQATPYDNGLSYWGDQGEMFCFWDETTRKIDTLILQPGYKGVITAGDYVFEINEPIRRAGVDMDKVDGSELDPESDENMRLMNIELVRAFRPSISNPDDVDCVEDGSCFLVASGTVNIAYFNNTGIILAFEPSEHRIAFLYVTLVRPFKLAMSNAKVEGSALTLSGKGDIAGCNVTYGTTWEHIRNNCLGGDSESMINLTSVWDYEVLLAQMGGVSLYFKRPTLGETEILPPIPTLDNDDEIILVSINSMWEGDFDLPYTPILENFKTNLQRAIRDELNMGDTEKTGVELLRTPLDPDLPADVQLKYKNKLRPGGVYAAFCRDLNEPAMDAGVDGGGTGEVDYYCFEDASGKYSLPLINTIKDYVSHELGTRALKKHSDPAYYVQHFERAMSEYFNGDSIQDNQINYRMMASNTVYSTTVIKDGADRYTYNVYFTGLNDRMHFLNFLKGGTRTEEVLYADAENSNNDVFKLDKLRGSCGLGLGAIDTVKVLEYKPEIRRALLEISWPAGSEKCSAFNIKHDKLQVLASYQKASSITGYWTPLPGFHDLFTEADWFSLTGGTIGAGFYMLPSTSDASKNEIVAMTSSAFFGVIPWCDTVVRVGDPVDELLASIAEAGYPCEMVMHHSENYAFLTSVTDVDGQIELLVEDNMVSQAISWLR